MKTSSHLGWATVILMVSMVACSAAPPHELIERNDHAGLATWYEEEAARLRGREKEMRQMAEEYAKPSYRLSAKENRAELITHCQLFIESSMKAAQEAEALATLHREQNKAAR
jgi:hypothetical protein